MFRLMALGLGLEETYFDQFVDSRDLTPEAAEKSRGVGAHTDFGALTLLMQDDGNHYITPTDQRVPSATETWHSVNPVKDAYVVNIGDMMQQWTNNRYTSTLHRVISPVTARDRFSVAFFNEGLLDQVIECIPTCLEPGEKPLHEPVVVETHLRKTYGNSY
ncbi:sexual differentiation process protein isp7 [Apodospora peruviana]|uniref:Sexual differentiation process protein isp7 n=1 Tax=Apodospora peruviana TaxID=516989 RepID=A0AAE0IH87_9PEZI|nr:sexual differentiation process protein isp7 [Apodospora peruviana]